MYRVMDLDNIEALRVLLAHGGNPNEPARFGPPTTDWGSPLLWAIRRRRSRAHIEALLQAGADPLARTPDGTTAHTWAARFGLPDVAELLRQPGDTTESASETEQFVAACARADAAVAEAILARRPDIVGALSDAHTRLLPELAAEGRADAVTLMARLGWPIAVRGGDWSASALNLAVFRGDAALTRFLLEHGASWREQHGHGDNASGTLSWASRNQPADDGDWVGCAEALVAHGMPAAKPDPDEPGCVVIDGHRKRFSEEVTEFLLQASQHESQPPGSR